MSNVQAESAPLTLSAAHAKAAQKLGQPHTLHTRFVVNITTNAQAMQGIQVWDIEFYDRERKVAFATGRSEDEALRKLLAAI